MMAKASRSRELLELNSLIHRFKYRDKGKKEEERLRLLESGPGVYVHWEDTLTRSQVVGKEQSDAAVEATLQRIRDDGIDVDAVLNKPFNESEFKRVAKKMERLATS
jgi:hypothetical protein